jgi:hypothetical protein
MSMIQSSPSDTVSRLTQHQMDRMDPRVSMTRNQALLASAVEAIGETPVVELSRLTRGLNGRILV